MVHRFTVLLSCVFLTFIATNIADAQNNVAPPPDGFVPLFNGKNLDGWKATGKASVWGVDNGMLYVNGGGGGWLMTTKQYGDFQLELEFRLPKGKKGNSGVALRSPLKGNPAYAGMEIQLIDDLNWPGLQSWQHTGSIYNVVPAKKIVTRQPGLWNQMRITCKGRHVKIELNDATLVDANLDDYKAKHAKRHPGILRDKGHIGLQSYNHRIDFRNIWLKPL